MLIYCFGVVGAVLQSIFRSADVLEKKDDAVDGTVLLVSGWLMTTDMRKGHTRPPTLPQCSNSVRVEGDEFLELHIFHSQLLDKGSEHALDEAVTVCSLRRLEQDHGRRTSSDSMVLQPPAEGPSAMLTVSDDEVSVCEDVKLGVRLRSETQRLQFVKFNDSALHTSFEPAASTHRLSRSFDMMLGLPHYDK